LSLRADRPSLAVVIPAFNAAPFLKRVLPAAQEAARGRAEVLVVDAGSPDDTAVLAEELGTRVVRLPVPTGPSGARNAGAAAVATDVILFIDADCRAHPDVVDRVAEAFRADPELVALTGSYDEHPPERGFFSQYSNLRHHFTHQIALRENATWWAGCGAVRREAFLAVGGFDAERYPNGMEDTELGLRLAQLGPTRLDPKLQVTHLKRWTLRSLVETEVRRRAIPWSRLILERAQLPNDLNLRSSQRMAAAIAPLALLSLVAGPVAAVAGSGSGVLLATLLVALSVALNWGMLRAFARLRGIGFAAGAWLFHQVHLLYSGVVFAICSILHWRRARPLRSA
jgi:GT2 family glycosyltransferase